MPLTITIPGAVEATIGATAPAVLTIGVGIPGPTGAQGPAGAAGSQGPIGPQGEPGEGVPTGGSIGQYLVKTSGVDFATGWQTLSLSNYLSLDGGEMNANAEITFEDTALGRVALASGSAFAVSSSSNPDLVSNVLFDRIFVKNATSQTTLKPTGVEFPDLTLQTTAGLSPATAATTYQTLAGMSSYLTTSAAASTYAVIARGLPASGTVGQVLTKNSGTDYDCSFQTLIPGDRYLTTSSTSNAVSNGAKTFTVSTGLSYTTQQDVTIAYDATHHMHAVVTSYNSGTGVLVVDVQSHTGSGTFTSWTVNVGGTVPLQSVAWGDITGTLGSQSDLATALNNKLEVTTAASTYLALAGGAMTGSITSVGTTHDTEMSGELFGVQLSADHSKGSVLQFNGLDTYDGASHMLVTPAGLTFPDTTTQTTAGLSPATAASTYYLQTNPSGFIGDAPSNGSQYARKNGAWDVVSSSGGTWGSITGTITSQTDLTSYVLNQTNAYALRDATARDYTTSLDAFPITLASTSGLYSVELQVNNIGYQGIAINFVGGGGYSFTNYGTYLQFDYNSSDDVGTIVSNLNGLGSGFTFTLNDISGTGPYYNTLSNIASLDRGITVISGLTGQEVMFKSELDSYLIDDAVSKGMTSAWSQYAPLISVSGSGAAVSYGKPWETWAYSTSATDSLLTAKASLSGATFTGLLITKASAAGGAGFRLTSGVAPTTPQTGDFWFDGTNLKAGIGGGTTGTLPFLSTGNTWTGVNNFGASTGTFAAGTGGGAISIGSGATTTGLTKTLNLGINGAAGSTTNIVVGSTTGTSTTTLQGTTNGVTATALDSSTKLATTAFVRGDNNVKSRVTFTGTGTVTIRSSFNVSSITDNGVGDYRVNFTAAIADVNYSVSGSANDSTAGSTYLWLATGSASNADISRLTTSVRIQTIYGTALKLDASTVDVIVSR